MKTHTKDGITMITADIERDDGMIHARLSWEAIEALGTRGALALNHRIAALVQELSGDGPWGVHWGYVNHGSYTRNDCYVGSIYLETDRNTLAQAERGLAVLEKVIEVIKTVGVRGA